MTIQTPRRDNHIFQDLRWMAAIPECTTLNPADLRGRDHFRPGGWRATQALLSLITILPGIRLIDLGCGVGGLARMAADTYHCHVVAVDRDEESLRLNHLLNRACGLTASITVVNADAVCLPLDNAIADVVTLQCLAMLIADRSRLWAEAARILKPGGRILMSEILRTDGQPIRRPVPWAIDNEPDYVIAEAQWQQDAVQTGLTVEKLIDRGTQHAAWYRDAVTRTAHQERLADAYRAMASNLSQGHLRSIDAVLTR